MKEYIRNCPKCNKEIIHIHYVSYRVSIKNNKMCSKCANIERANRPEEKIKNSERQLGTRTGVDNPFYGKNHTTETKTKIKKARQKQIIPKGYSNPLFGKKLEEIVGNEKANDIKTKKSISYTGKGNPMYGKPSPNGSGNGWSGWYNGWFFRSILELSYMIKVIDRYNIKWESGEKKEYKIKYIDKNGTPRNYFSDFIIAKKYIIEIKPNKLKNTISVLEKRNAAIEYSNKLNMKYKITNVPPLTDTELKELIDTNKIQLTERYIKKYKEKYANKNN